jgi:hypothetical protein
MSSEHDKSDDSSKFEEEDRKPISRKKKELTEAELAHRDSLINALD